MTGGLFSKYGVITNGVSDYINLLVRIAHIIYHHPLSAQAQYIDMIL
jgi:hypothetical protein